MRTSGPLSVQAMVCSKWAERLAVAGDDGPAVGEGAGGRLARRSPSARSPRRGRSSACSAGSGRRRSWGSAGPRASRCRSRGRRTHARPSSRADSATSCTAAPTSPSVWPTRTWSIAASSERAGDVDQVLRLVVDLADRHRDRGVGVPALDDRPAVEREDVALLEHGVVGDAVHDHVVRRRADHRREAVVVEEVRPGAAVARAPRRATWSISSVVTPGLAASVQRSCISATTRPARRISAIWSRFLRVITAPDASGPRSGAPR